MVSLCFLGTHISARQNHLPSLPTTQFLAPTSKASSEIILREVTEILTRHGVFERFIPWIREREALGNDHILALINKYMATNYRAFPRVIKKSKGVYLWDLQDNRIIDFFFQLFCPQSGPSSSRYCPRAYCLSDVGTRGNFTQISHRPVSRIREIHVGILWV